MGKEFDSAASMRQTALVRPAQPVSRALPQNRQWADFLRSLQAGPSAPDPLLPQAKRFHPRRHMDIRNEEDRLALLQGQCLRLCKGDEARAKRLAADVIWAGSDGMMS